MESMGINVPETIEFDLEDQIVSTVDAFKTIPYTEVKINDTVYKLALNFKPEIAKIQILLEMWKGEKNIKNAIYYICSGTYHIRFTDDVCLVISVQKPSKVKLYRVAA